MSILTPTKSLISMFRASMLLFILILLVRSFNFIVFSIFFINENESARFKSPKYEFQLLSDLHFLALIAVHSLILTYPLLCSQIFLLFLWNTYPQKSQGSSSDFITLVFLLDLILRLYHQKFFILHLAA